MNIKINLRLHKGLRDFCYVQNIIELVYSHAMKDDLTAEMRLISNSRWR